MAARWWLQVASDRPPALFNVASARCTVSVVSLPVALVRRLGTARKRLPFLVGRGFRRVHFRQTPASRQSRDNDRPFPRALGVFAVAPLAIR